MNRQHLVVCWHASQRALSPVCQAADGVVVPREMYDEFGESGSLVGFRLREVVNVVSPTPCQIKFCLCDMCDCVHAGQAGRI